MPLLIRTKLDTFLPNNDLFCKFLFKITLFLDRKFGKMTIVISPKFWKMNRMLAFYTQVCHNFFSIFSNVISFYILDF